QGIVSDPQRPGPLFKLRLAVEHLAARPAQRGDGDGHHYQGDQHFKQSKACNPPHCASSSASVPPGSPASAVTRSPARISSRKAVSSPRGWQINCGAGGSFSSGTPRSSTTRSSATSPRQARGLATWSSGSGTHPGAVDCQK